MHSLGNRVKLMSSHRWRVSILMMIVFGPWSVVPPFSRTILFALFRLFFIVTVVLLLGFQDFFVVHVGGVAPFRTGFQHQARINQLGLVLDVINLHVLRLY